MDRDPCVGLRRHARGIVTMPKNPNDYATGAYFNGVKYYGLSGLYLRTRDAHLRSSRSPLDPLAFGAFGRVSQQSASVQSLLYLQLHKPWKTASNLFHFACNCESNLRCNILIDRTVQLGCPRQHFVGKLFESQDTTAEVATNHENTESAASRGSCV